jgi:serine/threonine protein phosphatase PrpC
MQQALVFYQLTTAGDRAINQDCMGHRIEADYAVFIVADGLGGHAGGEKASQSFCRAVLALADSYQPQLVAGGAAALKQWLAAAVQGMRRLLADDPALYTAHTTVALLYLDDRQLLTAHCGDTRIYRLNPQQVLWRTRDHSLTQQWRDLGMIDEAAMGAHPDQNQLTRTINAMSEPVLDVERFPPLQIGETMVLCSDGFWERIKPQEWLQLAQANSDKQDLRKLAQLAVLRAQGGSDNVTVQWIRKSG